MSRQLTTTMTLLLLSITLGFGARAQAPAADAPPAGVQITREGAMLWSRGNLPDLAPLKADIVAAVWASEAGKRLPKELGVSDQAARSALSVSMPQGTPIIRLELTLPRDTPDVRKAGLKFIDELAGHVIPDAVSRWADEANHQPLAGAGKEVEEHRKALDEATARSAQQRHAVRDAANVLDPSPEAVRGAASRLDQEKQRITLELAGQAARQKALEERVAKLADAAAARLDKDPIADELEKIVKLRAEEAATSEAMYKSGTLTQAELRAAQARAAEARARLLERREAVSKSAGTELLGDLNKELVTLTITIAENEARLHYLDDRLSGLSKALELVDQLEQLQAAAARARRQLDEAETQYQSLSHQIATAPSLVVNVQWTDPVFEPAGAPRQPPGGGGGGGLFGGSKGDGR